MKADSQKQNNRMNGRSLRRLFLLMAVLTLFFGVCRTVNAASLSVKKLTLVQGESGRLRLKGASGEVEWVSANSKIAEVGEKGLVRALYPGKCKIQAICGEKKYSCRIIVKALEFEQPTLTMVRGRKHTLRFNYENVTGAVWSSSDSKVVSVHNGVIRSEKPGKAVITARWNGISVKCSVTVKDISPEYLSQAYPAVKSNRGKLLLAGSSSMDFWQEAHQAFAPYEVINTAIEGTTVMQWLSWYQTLITRYKPGAVVLYVGSNDIGNGDSVSGEENAENTILLLKRITKKLKKTPVFYVSINPCWSRKDGWKKISTSNMLVKNFCDKKKNLYYIDITSAFAGKDGTPNPIYFLSDKLHPSAEGYQLWEQQIANQVKKIARKSLNKNLKKNQKKSKKN